MGSEKLKKCVTCGAEFKPFRTYDKFCSYKCHNKGSSKPKKRPRVYITRAKKISPVSKKQSALLRQYSIIRKKFLSLPSNRFCAVYPNKLATEVHHMKKRRGHADKWAIENNLPLLIDARWFLAVSREGHQFIEENPKEARARGWEVENKFAY